MFCPKCGTRIDRADDRFCRACGASLSSAFAGGTGPVPTASPAATTAYAQAPASTQTAEPAQKKSSGTFIGVIVAILVVCALVFGPDLFSSDEPEPAKPQAVEISDKTFPDDGFRNYVGEEFDQDADGTLSEDEVAQIEAISVYGDGVTSFEGIQYFVNLNSFTYTENVYVTDIDLSQNVNLTSVEVRGKCDATVILPAGMNRANVNCGKNVEVIEADEPDDFVDEDADGSSSDQGEGSKGGASAAAENPLMNNTSSWTQQYQGVWYMDGIPDIMGGVHLLTPESAYPLNMDATRMLIHEDYVYYLRGSIYDTGAASLYRQPLGGGQEELLLDSLVRSDEFHLLNGWIYFMGCEGAYSDEYFTGRVSLDGAEMEYLPDGDWIVGVASQEGYVFAVDYGDDTLYRYDPDMTNPVPMPVTSQAAWGFGEAGNGLYYAIELDPDSTDLYIVFFDAEGNYLGSAFSNGGYAAPFNAGVMWSDGQQLYISGTGGFSVVDLESRETVEWMDVNAPVDCLGDVSPLYVDETCAYYMVSYEYGEGPDIGEEVTATVGVCRYDRETGQTDLVDAWYEQ